MKSAKLHLKDVASLLFKCCLAGGIVFWLVKSGQLNFAKIAGADPNWLLLAGLLQIPMLFGPLFRWYLLAKAQGLDIELGDSIHVGLIGYFASILVPSGLGLDGSRAVYAMRRCPGQAVKIVSTLVMDRLIGLASMIFLGAVFGGLLLLQKFDMLLAGVVLVLWVALAGLGALTLVILDQRFSNLLAPLTRWVILDRVHGALVSYREHKGKLLEGFVLTLPGHVGILAATYFTFVALGLVTVPPLSVFALTPVVSLSAIIPLTPMGLGVSEWVASSMYARYQYIGGADVNMALRLVTLVLMLLCGVATLIPMADVRPLKGAADVPPPPQQPGSVADSSKAPEAPVVERDQKA